GPQYKDKLPFPVVAIYPKEGTCWSDHPVGIVQRAWVKDEHREAGKIYIDFLLQRAQQEKALKYGCRPGVESIPPGQPVDVDHGVDPKEPRTILDLPPVPTLEASLKNWRQFKKHSRVVLVLDTSGSMNLGGKLVNAKKGAQQVLSMLGDED